MGWTRVKGSCCIYCGEHATTDEHFPPQVTTNSGYIFPACFECNTLANTEHPFDIHKRVEYVRTKLKLRYNKILKMPDWTESELKELSEDLKKFIQTGMTEKLKLQKRLEWPYNRYLKQLGV